jgi:methyltransferase family protein
VRRVLNVGGGSKAIPIPPHYGGWEHVLLDVNPAQKPDVVGDARELAKLPAELYDAVYCSHNLEHYWRHDLPAVLAGFVHVLRAHGFAEVAVPDLKAVFAEVLAKGLDLESVLYESDSGPITVNDVIYGHGREIAMSRNDFYAHKNGFTQQSLAAAFRAAGFQWVFMGSGPYEILALAFKQAPTDDQRALLRLPSTGTQ